jgi:hypothetical protein
MEIHRSVTRAPPSGEKPRGVAEFPTPRSADAASGGFHGAAPRGLRRATATTAAPPTYANRPLFASGLFGEKPRRHKDLHRIF